LTPLPNAICSTITDRGMPRSAIGVFSLGKTNLQGLAQCDIDREWQSSLMCKSISSRDSDEIRTPGIAINATVEAANMARGSLRCSPRPEGAGIIAIHIQGDRPL
jgi:hypothetical protein